MTHSEETLLFYKDILGFKRRDNQQWRDNRAIEIFNTYIEENSIKSLNINHVSRNTVKQLIQNPPVQVDAFDAIQQEIILLLEEDTYQRFLASSQFKAFSKKFKTGRSIVPSDLYKNGFENVERRKAHSLNESKELRKTRSASGQLPHVARTSSGSLSVLLENLKTKQLSENK